MQPQGMVTCRPILGFLYDQLLPAPLFIGPVLSVPHIMLCDMCPLFPYSVSPGSPVVLKNVYNGLQASEDLGELAATASTPGFHQPAGDQGGVCQEAGTAMPRASPEGWGSPATDFAYKSMSLCYNQEYCTRLFAHRRAAHYAVIVRVVATRTVLTLVLHDVDHPAPASALCEPGRRRSHPSIQRAEGRGADQASVAAPGEDEGGGCACHRRQ